MFDLNNSLSFWQPSWGLFPKSSPSSIYCCLKRKKSVSFHFILKSLYPWRLGLNRSLPPKYQLWDFLLQTMRPEGPCGGWEVNWWPWWWSLWPALSLPHQVAAELCAIPRGWHVYFSSFLLFQVHATCLLINVRIEKQEGIPPKSCFEEWQINPPGLAEKQVRDLFCFSEFCN